MVHYYLGDKTTGGPGQPSEVYALNGCVQIDKGLALRNPRNYEAYVASEWIHPFLDHLFCPVMDFDDAVLTAKSFVSVVEQRYAYASC